jgi:hypothetical protein
MILKSVALLTFFHVFPVSASSVCMSVCFALYSTFDLSLPQTVLHDSDGSFPSTFQVASTTRFVEIQAGLIVRRVKVVAEGHYRSPHRGLKLDPSTTKLGPSTMANGCSPSKTPFLFSTQDTRSPFVLPQSLAFEVWRCSFLTSLHTVPFFPFHIVIEFCSFANIHVEPCRLRRRGL